MNIQINFSKRLVYICTFTKFVNHILFVCCRNFYIYTYIFFHVSAQKCLSQIFSAYSNIKIDTGQSLQL